VISYKALIEAGVHYGHQTSRRHPKMAPYIWGHRDGVNLIDVSKTAYNLEQAAQFLESIAAKGGSILWLGSKKSAQTVVTEVAQALEQPYVVHRWIGGTFTNHHQVKKMVGNLMHCEDIIAKSGQFPYTKKEFSVLQKKIDRLQNNVGGIRKLGWPVGAIVIVDVRKESTALKEAAACGVPVVALVDTNTDPSMVDYVIPANDDSPKSIRVIAEYLKEAIARGKQEAQRVKAQAKAEQVAQQEAKAAAGEKNSEKKSASQNIKSKSVQVQGQKSAQKVDQAQKPVKTEVEGNLEVVESAELKAE
jgi:small subunit ribosomal protein S2